MIQSDALSQQPDLCPDEDTNNEDIIVLPDDLFISLIDDSLQQRIANSTDFDGIATETLKILLDAGLTTITKGLNDWTMDKSNSHTVLFYQGQNYIPQDTTLRWDILYSFHDHETAGHPGELGTYNAVHQHYWWPGL